MDFSLQVEAFCELGIHPELAYIFAEAIVESEETYCRMLLLSEKLNGNARDLLLKFIQKFESFPRELSESVLPA